MKPRHAAALLLTVLACTSPGVASPGESCQDNLVGNSYYCTMFFESGEPPLEGGYLTSACIKFVTGNLSSNFDLVAVAFGLLGQADYGCECEITNSRSLNSHFYDYHVFSDAFECVGDPVNLVQLHGKVDSPEKLHGQGSEANGSIFEFVCTTRSTACE